MSSIKNCKMFSVTSVLCFVCFLIWMDLVIFIEAYRNPSPDFSKHSIVKPKLQHGRTKRDITSTKDFTGSHHPEVTLTVSIDGEDQELELRLNEALVPSGHALSYQKDGQTRVHAPGKEELELCQYSGRVRGRAGSWAALSTCRGVRGVLYDGAHLLHIEPVHGDVNGDHFLYSQKHLTTEHRCGNPDVNPHNASYDSRQHHNEDLQQNQFIANRYKRDTADAVKVRAPYNANQRSRYVELVLVVDNSQYRANGEDLDIVHLHMKDIANIINSVYAPLNIFIALVGVEVWTEYDKIKISEDADNTLTAFNEYRTTQLLKRIPNDNAHFFTQRFNSSTVGRASVRTMCSAKNSSGVATNHSDVIGVLALTIAHEMGHNFGMYHDYSKTSCKCPEDRCIMSPTSSQAVHWSSCSLQYLSLSFEKSLDYCLRNEPKRLFSSPTCGNGFLEEGEECDCGSAPREHAPGDSRGGCHGCCTRDCKLRTNATCAHGQCCDITTCQPKPIGMECRSAAGDCDLPEFCTGTSPFCPNDVYKMDAISCKNGEAYCVRGSCRSHTDQCRLLFGITGYRASDLCYDLNTDGSMYGNCGYDRESGTYRRCEKQDVSCGKLQCSHLSKELEFGNFQFIHEEIQYGWTERYNVKCQIVVADNENGDTDPGSVPDGAKCGTNKMCLKQKCLPVERVREMMKQEGSVCSSNCSGHGVCNSNGNCHCDPGFAPPLCAEPGEGGSQDSGPMADTTDFYWFMVAMYIIFLGIVPALALVFLLVRCLPCRKRENHYESPPKPRFGSKPLPNFSSFRNLLKNDTKVNDNSIKRPVPQHISKNDIEHHIDTEIEKNSTKSIEPVKSNRKLQKEDIVIVENCHAPVHAPFNNYDGYNPKVDSMKNKFESLSCEQKSSSPPNYRNLNKELATLKNDKIGSPINRPNPHLVPKPKLSPNPGGSPKHSIANNANSTKLGANVSPKTVVSSKPVVSNSPKPRPNVCPKNCNLKPSVNIKPSVSPKPNRLPCGNNLRPDVTNADNSSTTIEFLNQRSKLRKVSNIRDVNK